MKEDFLHFLWDYGKVAPSGLRGTEGEQVQILDRGELNTNAGPDFLNALIALDDKLWAGHVEMHLRSSLWYDHGHHLDENYHNVILHVVWKHDMEVHLPDGSRLPVLELNQKVSGEYLKNYREISAVQPAVVNCARMHHSFSVEQWQGWLEQLFLKRQEDRFQKILAMSPDLRTHWEELLFRAVFRYAGARVNADAFYSLARAVGIEKVRKMVAAGDSLEIVFHGLTGLLSDRGGDQCYRQRKKEYRFLKRKYHLCDRGLIRPVFFRLRPYSFPTLRLSQLAAIYEKHDALFAAVLSCTSLSALRKLFTVSADGFWDNRYTYSGPVSPLVPKALSRQRADIIILNAVFPVLYGYYRNRGSEKCLEVLTLASGVPAERNKVLNALKKVGFPVNNARDSQAVLELYNTYCTKNRCLHCRVGRFIIGG